MRDLLTVVLDLTDDELDVLTELARTLRANRLAPGGRNRWVRPNA